LRKAIHISFHTILSIIPILLISFSIFTKLPSFEDYYAKIQDFVFSALLPSNQEIISNYLQNFLQNSGNLGIVGFVAMIFTSATLAVDKKFDYYKKSIGLKKEKKSKILVQDKKYFY